MCLSFIVQVMGTVDEIQASLVVSGRPCCHSGKINILVVSSPLSIFTWCACGKSNVHDCDFSLFILTFLCLLQVDTRRDKMIT